MIAYPLLYTIGGVPSGKSTRVGAEPPLNLAFFCPVCGDIWARRTNILGKARWLPFEKPCPKHGPTGLLDWTILIGGVEQPDDKLLTTEFLLRSG